MTASTLSDRTRSRLRDMVDDADRILHFVEGMTLEMFVSDERTVFAVERLLQRITEAAVQIAPAEAAQLGPDVPVAKMRAFGNRLRHEYRDIARDVIFDLARGAADPCGRRTGTGARMTTDVGAFACQRVFGKDLPGSVVAKA